MTNSESNPVYDQLARTVQEVQSFLEVDRVCLYRFANDGSGQVIREARLGERLPSLLHLHFPASDIPARARDYFLQGRLRVIVDTSTGRKALHEIGNESNNYVLADPCHVEYLRRLGVQSSLTFPVIVREQLWGLLLIHHGEPRRWQDTQLTMLELWVERLALSVTTELLSQKERSLSQQEAILTEISELLGGVANHYTWQSILEKTVSALDGCGGRLQIKGDEHSGRSQTYTIGQQPSELLMESSYSLQDSLLDDSSASSRFQVIHFELPTLMHSERVGVEETTRVKSVLMITLSAGKEILGDINIFRPEIQSERWWAGHPPNGIDKPLSPRVNFQPWREIRRGQFQEWSEDEIRLSKAIAERVYGALRHQQLDSLRTHSTQYDALTNLPNRHLFTKQLGLALIEANSTEEVMAVVFLDLDRFTQVNKNFGHEAGDKLLQLVAKRLKGKLFSANYLLAHWNSDKFIYLLRHLQGKGGASIEQICQKLTEALKSPFDLDGETVYITASFGVSIAPYDGTSPELLLLNAESAMYNAKKQGGATYQFYTPSLEERLNPITLEADLRKSLEKDEFVLYYQPQVSLTTNEVVGMEALIRWQHPQRGVISPGEFIPIAEESTLICDIGKWTLRKACQQHKQWRAKSLGHIKIAVNISARQFQQADFVDTVAQILAETQTPASALEIEITEGTAAYDLDLTTTVLRKLQKMGIQVALDDFGTGYSSLNSIKHFPLNTLKIDKSFVEDLINDFTDAALVKAIIALGHGLKLQVFAEGVETYEQLEVLQMLNCDIVQGYLISRPLIPSQATEFLQSSLSVLPDTAEDCEGKEVAYCTLNSTLRNLLIHAQQEKLVAQISQQIRSSLDLDVILNTTVREIRQFLGNNRVILYQFAPNWSGEVVVESVDDHRFSVLGEKIDDPCFQLKSAPLYSRGRISAIADVDKANLQPCYYNLLRRYQIKANLVVPILIGDSLWGLMIAHHCESAREWHAVEIELLERLSSQVAIAIHQAQLYAQLEKANQDLQRQAIQDGLTGIANRRHFDEYIAQEWQRLQRQNEPLSLILCDVDYFKLYNDTYGHLAGDECLKRLAAVMTRVAQRPCDLIARYGGEEFAIILPQTHAFGAYHVAENLRHEIQKLQLPHKNSQVSSVVTLSLGIATLTPHAKTAPALLIQSADYALYEAKQNGRNRSQIFSFKSSADFPMSCPIHSDRRYDTLLPMIVPGD